MIARMVRVGWALGREFALHTLRRVFLPPGPGGAPERYAETFGAEGLFPLTPPARAAIASFGRCIGCGLCLVHAPRGGVGPPEVILSLSRPLPDLPRLRPALLAFDAPAPPGGGGGLDARVEGCPVGAPFAQVVAFVRGGTP